MGEARISRKEAARRLGVSVLTVDRYADAGRLDREANAITRRVTFDASQVERVRRERETP